MNNNYVEQVFLIYEDGRLISYVSIKDDEEWDEDIISGMLTAIMNILNIAIKSRYDDAEDTSICRFMFGKKRLIIEKGNTFFIAIILLGKEDESLLSNVGAIIRDIEQKYVSNLDHWNGDLGVFDGVDDVIITLLPLDKLSETEKKAIKDYKDKIFGLWSKKYHSIIQNGLLPKPHIWKDFDWKIDIEQKKENKKEEEDI
jgi:hypothetical protein